MVSVKKVYMRFVLNFLCGNYSFEALKLKYITRLIALTTVVQNVVKAKVFPILGRAAITVSAPGGPQSDGLL